MQFETVRISSEAAMEAPVDVVFHENGIKVYGSLIPQCYNYSKRVWFVSGDNGDEFGQFALKSQAISHGIFVARSQK